MAKRLQYMDALGPTIEKAKFAAAGGDVAAEEARLMDPNYIAPGVMEQFKGEGTLQPYTPTMRENYESDIAGLLQKAGMSKQSARDSAIGFTGTTDSSRGGMGVGVLDFVPLFSFPTAGQEVSREIDRLGNDPNATAIDYLGPAVTTAFTVAEAIPAAKLATKPLKSFISKLAAKSKADPIAEPLIASAGPDASRRKFLKGAAVAPLAVGALSTVGQKVAPDILEPVAKKAVAPVAKKVTRLDSVNFLSNLNEFKRAVLQSELEGQNIDEITDFMSTKPNSLDELSDSQIDEVFEYNYGSADPRARADLTKEKPKAGELKPTMQGIEKQLKEDMSNILDDTMLSPKDFVEGTEPTGDVLDIFVQRMKKSGYKESEIAELLERILERD
jgi:hypothetical protein